jgi:predicted enzyme related to lactoylglutathione lyase
MNVLGIDIHTYLVKDAARAIAFYRDVMGLPVAVEYDGMGAEFELPDGSTFGLWKPDGDMPWQPSQGIMFAVPDIGAAVAELRSKGVQASEPHDFPPCFMAFAQDTEGNQIILHQRKDGTHG